jgi:hypothetical protein
MNESRPGLRSSHVVDESDGDTKKVQSNGAAGVVVEKDLKER